MAKGTRAVVGNAAAILVHDGTVATVTNRDAANSVSLGGKTVAAGAGYELKAGETITVDARGEDIYAIRDGAADVRVDVLATRGIQL